MSPFEIVYGFNPTAPTDMLPLPRSEHLNSNGRDRARQIQEMHKDVKQRLEKAAQHYAKQANKGRRELILHPGDWVWVTLRSERFPNKRRNKLSPRGEGPFRVLARINNNAYKIELPAEYNISTTFNVADLTLFERDADDDFRMKDHPFQGGGDDADIKTSESQEEPSASGEAQNTLCVLRYPEGPVSRQGNVAFAKKLRELLRKWEEATSAAGTEDRDRDLNTKCLYRAKSSLLSKVDRVREA